MMILVNFRRKKVVCLNRAACGQASKLQTRCADFSSLLICSLFTSYKITGAQSHTFKSIQNMVLFSKSLLFSFLKVNLPPCFFPSQDFTLFSRSCFPFPTPQCCV